MPKSTSVVMDRDVRYWLDRYARARNVSRSRAFNNIFRSWWRKLTDEERAYIESFESDDSPLADDELIDIPVDSGTLQNGYSGR